jgi:hypothetical protein
MSDYKLPDLPSDDELGITEEDLRALEDEQPEAVPAKKGGKKGSGPPPATPGGADDDELGDGLSRWRGPVTLLAMVALAWTASIRTGIPQVTPADAPDSVFSAARAMSVVGEIVRAPRPTGSPEHARVRGELVARLAALGLDPEVQTGTALLEGAGFARAATVRNVVARMPGTDPTGAVLVTAHYDGTELSPGAGDDASGLATILEAVRAVRAGTPLRNDVIVLFTDAEEIGLLGAEAFVRDHPWLADVQVVVSFEMRGSGGPSILFETADDNGIVVRALRDATPAAFGTSMGDEFFRHMPHGTDFTVFERAGKQGLNFAAIDNAAVYHTSRDIPSELSDRTVQHHGEHALGALRAFGAADLGEVRAPDVVYFSLPVIGFVAYPASWVLLLSGLLVVLAIGVFFVAIRAGARPTAVIAGFGASLIAVSLGYGAAYLLIEQSYGAHPEAGRLPAALFYGEGWYVLAMASASLLIVTLLLSVARTRLSVVELTLGAVVLPAAASVGLAFAAPLAAMHFQWPTLAALFAAGSLALLGHREDSWAGWLVALLWAIPVMVFFVPATELLWLAATLRQSGVLGAFMVVGLLLALPAVDALRTPNGWWLPLVALLGGAACVGMARLGSDVSAVTPLPTTLVYAYEHGTARGMWITDASTAQASPESEVGSWLAARTGNPFNRTAELGAIGYRTGSTPVADAPPAAAQRPTLFVQRDTTVGIVRRMTVEVRSEIGAERLYFRPSGGANGTRVVSVNGRPIADPFSVRSVDHWGAPDPMVVLELEMPAGADMELTISEHHLRPAEILGPGTFQRPPGFQPDVLRWSDRAILTSRYGTAPPTEPATDTPGPDTLASDTLAPDTLAADAPTADAPTADPLPEEQTSAGPDPGGGA